MTAERCSIPLCERAASSRGYCTMHYKRWWKHGDPLTVKPVLSLVERFEQHVDRSGGPSACWPWTGKRDSDGYGKIAGTRAHRVAFAQAHPEIDISDLHILHRCDNPPCVNDAHLFSGTNTDNIADRMAKHGRTTIPKGVRPSMPRLAMLGSRNPSSKLTADTVREIRIAAAAGESKASLARRYGVASSRVFDAVERRTWAHVA